MPSTAPSNVRTSNLHLGELKVQWDPIPHYYANGKLLGYRVYYHVYPYLNRMKTVNASSPDIHLLVIRGLKAAQRYRVSVAAFTSIGAGPRSPWTYVTTGTEMKQPYEKFKISIKSLGLEFREQS